MGIIKTIARRIIFPLLTGTGLERLISRISGHNRLIIMYHGISLSPNHSINGRHLDAKQFEKHLIYFKKHFNVVPLAEIFENYRTEKKINKPTIAITFDDGYENNFTVALPLLEKYDLPATFYVLSAALENDDFINWPDVLDILKYANPGEKNKIGDYDHFKKSGSERLQLITDLSNKYDLKSALKNIPRDHWKMAAKEELKRNSALSIVEIGSHTHNHFNLGNIHKDLAKQEMGYSKILIEKAINKKVISIAFPDGSYDQEVKKLALEAGYRNLAAVDYKCEDDKEDKNILPRFCISNTTTFESNMIMLNLAFGKKGF